MSTIPPEKIAEIRDRIDIERVIGRSVRLTRKGQRAWGLCPFHKEKSPSFSVNPELKLFHCFGCQAGGDVFHFVMRVEGVEFREAALMLAKEAGVEVEERDEGPREREARLRREKMLEVNWIAAAFYRRKLEESPRALAYLKQDRGLSDETIERFELGFAPNEWRALADHLEHKKIDHRLAIQLGLLGARSKDGSGYDRLRGRIVFPIMLPSGDVVGFGGRRCDWLPDQEESPKYLNSPESPIYDKSSILYGLKEAKDEIRRDRSAVLVEGYVDVIGMHQAGVPRAVASCGTALSLRHAVMLKRLAAEVVTLYDGDAAGQDAARKAAETLLREGVKVRVATLPEGEDPDTFAAKHGGGAVRELIEKAPAAIDFFVEKAKATYKGGGIAGMAKAVDAVKPLLLAIADPLERDVCLDATARALGLEPAILRRHLAAHREPDRSRNAPPAPPQPGTKRAKPMPIPAVEAAVLKMLLESPAEVAKVLEATDAVTAFTHPALQAAVERGMEAVRVGKPFDAPRAIEAANASGALDDQGAAALRKSLMEALPERDDIEVCVKRLLRNRNAITLQHLRQQLAKETDPKALEELAREADRLNRIMASLT
jgi:DNA primase